MQVQHAAAYNIIIHCVTAIQEEVSNQIDWHTPVLSCHVSLSAAEKVTSSQLREARNSHVF